MSIEYVFKCRGCGFINSTPWTFQCPACFGFYNINRVPGFNLDGSKLPIEEGQIVSLCDVEADVKPRTSTLIENVDRILGKSTLDGSSGFADGQIVMIYGDPGSGKSTLLLQIANGIARQNNTVILFAGEESLEQIKERADRIGKMNRNVKIVKETDLENVLDILYDLKPKVFIVDSLQKIGVEDAMTGSIKALTIASQELEKFCKAESVASFWIVQVGKDNDFQGPKAIEHNVDTSLHMRKIDDKHPRVLECHKNRFGSTDFAAHFWMQQEGMIEIPVENTNEYKEKDSGMATQTAPALTSIPLDLSQDALNEIDRQFPNPNLNSFWTAPEGTSASKILAVKCDVEECRGIIDHACTSANGTRESGFHDARIAKSKLKIPEEAAVVFEAPIATVTDLFSPGPLTAKPKLKKVRKPKKLKDDE